MEKKNTRAVRAGREEGDGSKEKESVKWLEKGAKGERKDRDPLPLLSRFGKRKGD